MAPTRHRLRDNLLVVLHQTQSPDNMGAVARLMTNFGFTWLMLSDPRTFAFQAAEKLAVRGEQVLTKLRVERTLAEALGDCVYAIGSTSRTELRGRPALTPEQAAVKLAENAARGQVALVMGGEKRGLSDAELDLCQDILVIPTEPEQPSMNLAQATGLLLYLCSREDRRDAEQGTIPPDSVAPGFPLPVNSAKAPAAPGTHTAPSSAAAILPGARLATIAAMRARMRDAFEAADFLNPQQPAGILSELLHTLDRAALSQREAEIWLNAFKHMERAIKGVTPRKKPE